jgi:hypothetical protein
MKFAAKRDTLLAQLGFFFAANFIQNLYTVLKKRLWESRSTPTKCDVPFRIACPAFPGQVCSSHDREDDLLVFHGKCFVKNFFLNSSGLRDFAILRR